MRAMYKGKYPLVTSTQISGGMRAFLSAETNAGVVQLIRRTGDTYTFAGDARDLEAVLDGGLGGG